MRMSNFSRMFEPIEIGKMTIRNRVIMPAMVTCFASDDGIVTDQLIGYYAYR
jgi:2,4-dienoyl-CoA reductase-like NADH-dependent reductase (Old Yellow Enzyme family)